MSIKRSPIARFHKIATILATGRHVQASYLSERLEVSTKTIFRDLEFMRDQLELPIESDGRLDVGGFHFTRPVALCACCMRSIK